MKENYQSITRIIVFFFVTVFIIVVTITVLLLVLYYLTPNNYVIELFDESKYYLIKKYIVKIKPETNIQIPTLDSDNNYLKFNQYDNFKTPIELPIDIELSINNSLKSQNIIYNKNELVYTRFGSNIIILNQSKDEINILISIYSLKSQIL